jgi:putative chitinase
MILTLEHLNACLPFAGARAAIYLECLNTAMLEFGIDTPQRIACFLAQVGHESGSLHYVEELADGMAYDITVNPTKAQELGNHNPGDGPAFKGAGLMQVTGARNTRRCLRALGRDESARDYLLTPMGACRSAAWYWKDRQLNVMADSGAFAALSKAINGGWNGIDDRIRHYVRIRKVLGI